MTRHTDHRRPGRAAPPCRPRPASDEWETRLLAKATAMHDAIRDEEDDL